MNYTNLSHPVEEPCGLQGHEECPGIGLLDGEKCARRASTVLATVVFVLDAAYIFIFISSGEPQENIVER